MPQNSQHQPAHSLHSQANSSQLSGYNHRCFIITSPPFLATCHKPFIPYESQSPTLAHRPVAVQNAPAFSPPLWQTCAHACPGTPVSVPVATRSYTASRLLPRPSLHALTTLPYSTDYPQLTPLHAQDWPDICACVPPRAGLPVHQAAR